MTDKLTEAVRQAVAVILLRRGGSPVLADEITRAALEAVEQRWQAFPTDEDVQKATAQFLKRPQGEDIEDTMRAVLEAVG